MNYKIQNNFKIPNQTFIFLISVNFVWLSGARTIQQLTQTEFKASSLNFISFSREENFIFGFIIYSRDLGLKKTDKNDKFNFSNYRQAISFSLKDIVTIKFTPIKLAKALADMAVFRLDSVVNQYLSMPPISFGLGLGIGPEYQERVERLRISICQTNTNLPNKLSNQLITKLDRDKLVSITVHKFNLGFLAILFFRGTQVVQLVFFQKVLKETIGELAKTKAGKRMSKKTIEELTKLQLSLTGVIALQIASVGTQYVVHELNTVGCSAYLSSQIMWWFIAFRLKIILGVEVYTGLIGPFNLLFNTPGMIFTRLALFHPQKVSYRDMVLENFLPGAGAGNLLDDPDFGPTGQPSPGPEVKPFSSPGPSIREGMGIQRVHPPEPGMPKIPSIVIPQPLGLENLNSDSNLGFLLEPKSSGAPKFNGIE